MASEPEVLRRKTTAETVSELIRSEIQRGVLQPGTRLRQNDVAARFGVSTTPVREAFALLQADGLVRIDPHRGAIVFHPTAEDLSESYEIRGALEVLAITKAMPNLTPELLSDMQSVIDEMRQTQGEDKWVELNDRFHLTLYNASEMPRLCSMIASLRDSSSTYIHMFVSHQPMDKRADDQHQEILDACKASDVRRAQRAVRAHINHTVKELRKFLKEQESTA
ncbi:MAG TPA: GntR family transcriptional regulator [Actinomycetota bacterium]|nr:GntR family transcriptional regulator [Actinomycetota bacterium]